MNTMNENDIIRLLDDMRGQSKDSSVLLIRRSGTEVVIASSSPDGALTASYSLSEASRMARNAMVSAIMQMLLTT